MIVAAGAGQGQADECAADDVDLVVGDVRQQLFLVGVAAAPVADRQQARGHEAFGQVVHLRNVDPLLVQVGPTSLLRGEQLLPRGIIDYRGNSPPFAFQCQRNAKDGKTVGEICGSIQRIHIPAVITAGFHTRAFFTQHVM